MRELETPKINPKIRNHKKLAHQAKATTYGTQASAQSKTIMQHKQTLSPQSYTPFSIISIFYKKYQHNDQRVRQRKKKET